MKQVPSKTPDDAAKEVLEIFKRIRVQHPPGHTGEEAAILTLAAVIHLNAHPIYVVSRQDVVNALAASNGK
jgi:hypothetical protein